MVDFGGVVFKAVNEFFRVLGKLIKAAYHETKMYFVYKKSRES